MTRQNCASTLTLQDYDRYSAALRKLEVGVTPSNAGDNTTPRLNRWAEQVVNRLSYLDEPLTLLELDETARAAQIRSMPPAAEEDTRVYWEVAIRLIPQPYASLTRYRWSPDLDEQEVVVYPATFAVLGRMAQDVVSALQDAMAAQE